MFSNLNMKKVSLFSVFCLLKNEREHQLLSEIRPALFVLCCVLCGFQAALHNGWQCDCQKICCLFLRRLIFIAHELCYRVFKIFTLLHLPIK